jgi:hypothetical protein
VTKRKREKERERENIENTESGDRAGENHEKTER